MNEKHLKQLILDYNLGEFRSITDITEGILNNNYLIETDKGKYFLKSIRNKKKASALYISEVERFMAERGIPAVQMLPVPNTQGERFVTYDEEVFTLYPFIESDRSHIYTNTEYRDMGRLLGEIHLAGSGELPDLLKTTSFTHHTSAEIIKRLLVFKDLIIAKSNKNDVDEKFLEYIDLKLSLAKDIEMPFVVTENILVHGDFHTGNLLIDKESRKIIGVCDWEKADILPHTYALAQSIMYIFFEIGFTTEETLHSVKYFIEGYNSVFPTTREELERGFNMRLDRMILTAWIEELHYLNNDIRADKFLENAIELLKMFVQSDTKDRLLDSVYK